MLKRPIEPYSVEVSGLDVPGCVLMVNIANFGNAFIARVSSSNPPPGSVLAGKPGEYFVAFSRLCTHMGAHLLGTGQESPETTDKGKSIPKVNSIAEDGVVRCPAHLTCFDLRHGGVVVIGQACASLPQIGLLPGFPGMVRLVDWMTPPYGEVDP